MLMAQVNVHRLMLQQDCIACQPMHVLTMDCTALLPERQAGVATTTDTRDKSW